jgi:hypothetical protein
MRLATVIVYLVDGKEEKHKKVEEIVIDPKKDMVALDFMPEGDVAGSKIGYKMSDTTSLTGIGLVKIRFED